MIPRKLVETAFSHFWLLLLPVVLAPLAVVMLTTKQTEYKSRAVVWVQSPPGDTRTLGATSPYNSPAQNQANALSDLLRTESFRLNVAGRAGLLSMEDPELQRRVAAELTVWAYSAGVNLIAVEVRSSSPVEAQKVGQGVIDEYVARSTTESAQASTTNAAYYTQQVTVANAELDTRRAALYDYVAKHPQVTDPKVAVLDIQYRTLQSLVDAQTAVVTDLSNKLQAAQLHLVGGPDEQKAAFAVQDPPSLPRAPLPQAVSRKFGLPAAGLLFGALISAVALFAMYRANHSVVSSEDLEGLPVQMLANIPDIRPSGFFRRIPVLRSILQLRTRNYAKRTVRAFSVSDPIEGGPA